MCVFHGAVKIQWVSMRAIGQGGAEKLKQKEMVPELMMDLDRETGELLDITWLDEMPEPRFILGDKEAWVVSLTNFVRFRIECQIHCDHLSWSIADCS